MSVVSACSSVHPHVCLVPKEVTESLHVGPGTWTWVVCKKKYSYPLSQLSSSLSLLLNQIFEFLSHFLLYIVYVWFLFVSLCGYHEVTYNILKLCQIWIDTSFTLVTCKFCCFYPSETFSVVPVTKMCLRMFKLAPLKMYCLTNRGINSDYLTSEISFIVHTMQFWIHPAWNLLSRMNADVPVFWKCVFQ